VCKLRKYSKKQEGASLLEVMVSVFIFSIGVLGFASLQSRSVQATFDNGQRDQVVWLTQTLIDRVRVNSTADAITQYTTTLTDFGDFGTDCTAPAVLCDAATCDDEQMAVFDVWDIYCRNIFQGSRAVKDLAIDLSCRDGACDSAAEDLNLRTRWCARGVEKVLDSGAAICDNTVAQMSYQVGFRP